MYIVVYDVMTTYVNVINIQKRINYIDTKLSIVQTRCPLNFFSKQCKEVILLPWCVLDSAIFSSGIFSIFSMVKDCENDTIAILHKLPATRYLQTDTRYKTGRH